MTLGTDTGALSAGVFPPPLVGPLGVIGDEARLATPVPIAFVALTVNV